MRWLEWITAGVLIIVGLGCLTMSAAWAAPFTNVHTFMHQLFLVCSWVFLPLGAFLLIYYALMKK